MQNDHWIIPALWVIITRIAAVTSEQFIPTVKRVSIKTEFLFQLLFGITASTSSTRITHLYSLDVRLLFSSTFCPQGFDQSQLKRTQDAAALKACRRRWKCCVYLILMVLSCLKSALRYKRNVRVWSSSVNHTWVQVALSSSERDLCIVFTHAHYCQSFNALALGKLPKHCKSSNWIIPAVMAENRKAD